MLALMANNDALIDGGASVIPGLSGLGAQPAQSGSHDLMVVNQQQANLGHRPSP